MTLSLVSPQQEDRIWMSGSGADRIQLPPIRSLLSGVDDNPQLPTMLPEPVTHHPLNTPYASSFYYVPQYRSVSVSPPEQHQRVDRVEHVSPQLSQHHQQQQHLQPPPPLLQADIKPGGPRPEKKEGRKYKCQTCGRPFTTSGHLARHLRIHTGERRHICPHEGCDAKFSRQDNCMQHYKTHLKVSSKRTKKKKEKGKTI